MTVCLGPLALRVMAAAMCSSLVLLITPPADGQEVSDYRTENEDWNGLSSLALLARSQGVVLMVRDEIRWRDINPADVLFFVNPRVAPETESVRRFVSEGGRLVVADDFGATENLAASFGLERQVTVEHALTFQHRDALPVLSPVGEHILSDGVSRVVANHPSAWIGPGVPVFRFDDGGALLYDLSLERGGAIFWSDPSMLINLMLPLSDNQQLARNVLNRVCDDRESCQVWLIVGDTDLVGEPVFEESERTFREVVESLQQRAEALTWPPGIKRAIGALLLLGALIIASTVFAWRAPRWIGVPLAALRERPPSGDFFRALHRYDGTKTTTYALPTAMLKDDFERRFYGALGLQRPTAGPGGRAGRRVAAGRWVDKTTVGLSERERRLRTQRVMKRLEEFASLPSRSTVAVTPHTALDLAKFDKYQRSAQQLLAPIESNA
ncbi:MAG: hypothetical protein ACI81R_001524 [Bradymonadia bacterium]|jgi:hypothetical protein